MKNINDIRQINKDFPKRIINEILTIIENCAMYNNWTYTRSIDVSQKRLFEDFIVPELKRLGFKVTFRQAPNVNYTFMDVNWSY